MAPGTLRKEESAPNLDNVRLVHRSSRRSYAPAHQGTRVALIGSGNWGCAIARIIGRNTIQNLDLFVPDIRMWVFEEVIDGQKLTDIINTKHENVKYLPGKKLPTNIIADPDLKSTVKDADVLIFCIPHQFLKKVCREIKGHIQDEAIAISLIKGIDSEDGLKLISDMIRDELQVSTSVLMGANIANEVADGEFCETTIGCPSLTEYHVYERLFNDENFRVTVVPDVYAVELCGALKNVVALGAGMVDGMDMGSNTKAAIMRIGLLEMIRFCKIFFTGIRDETFMESCGVADLITTCFGGRNRKCGEAFARTGKSFETLEEELLNGQKLAGYGTAKEVYLALQKHGGDDLLKKFPLLRNIYLIAYEGRPCKDLFQDL
eukprot:Clim_evm5s217 gene=Clim_evmTU5s217